jgi:hypothetical protein
VPQSPPACVAAGEILEAVIEPTHPFVVTYHPKWTGQAFGSGTVVCQHGRHRTLEGAARCAAAHVEALRKLPHYAVWIGTATSVMWKASDGRRGPRTKPGGE